MQKKDHCGERFGKLVAVKRMPIKCGKTKYLCVCDCGNEVIISGSNLVSGHSSSCGCLIEKHGKAKKERLYNIWVGMKQRCRDPKSSDYPHYGGKGISVCDEWIDNYAAFRKWALANGYSDDLSIDRIESDGNYEPSNCRWATSIIQNNNLTSNRIIAFRGEEKTLSEWAREYNLPYEIVNQRFQRGWDVERIFTTPIKRRGVENAT